MAERVRLVIPAGERKSHRVACHWDGADGRGTDVSLGRLEWNAAVLDERTVDIQVSLATLPREDGDKAGTESLDQQQQVRSLRGTFAPEEDEKYSDAEVSAAMEAVVFDFDNSSSWMTEKIVELVTIRTAAQPHNGLIPLPALAPLGPLPRPDQGTAPPLTTQALPDLRVPAETCIPTAESDAARFVQQLDALLAAAESKCPKGGAEDLVARVLELRSHCNKVLQDILPEKATVMSPEDISNAADEGELPMRHSEAEAPPSGRAAAEGAAYDRLRRFTDDAADLVASSGDGLVYRRGFGIHVLFKRSEMLPYFDEIREEIRLNGPGAALQPHEVTRESDDRHIWESLVKSLKFNGVDFEHKYKIVPSEREELMDTWNYTFAQSIVLSHTLLLVPVMQHYGPLMPKLDLRGPARKLEVPQPLLAVGLVGDCVKGPFFEEIKRKAETHDAVAMKQRDTLLDPTRLQQKLCGLLRALLEESSRHSPRCGLHVDATLVGTGAFGGSQKALAQPFVDSLNGVDMPFDESKDEVNFFIFPPPPKEDLTFESLRYNAVLNPKKGLGAPPEETSSAVRVVVAGFDPISLAPHGVIYRTFSAEGQLCHATDLLWRLTEVEGRFVPVKVPDGRAWESPAAFFARPQVPKFKPEEGYDSVRFVPESVLEELGYTGGHLVLKERGAARVWNGDSFEGWTLERGDGSLACTRSWQDALTDPC